MSKVRYAEFIGGPLCGCEWAVSEPRELEPHDVVFLSREKPKGKRFVHIYATFGYGEDYRYEGMRRYERGDESRVLGVVP